MRHKKSGNKSNPNALAIVRAPGAEGKQPSGRQIEQSQKPKEVPEATKRQLGKQPSGRQIEQSQKPKEVPEATKRQFAKWMRETFGTEHQALQDQLLCQAASAVSDFGGRELKTFDHIAAALHGIRPQDSLEGMLATQMIAAHTVAMTCMGRAAQPDQSDLGIEVNLNRATKLMRTFVLQIEALDRHRGKGEQKMVVEDVHVHEGGQAIVGPVSQNNSGNNKERGRSSNEIE